jgi:AcrR family transcriptional regulator
VSPRRPAGESRAAILAAARESFGNLGYQKTTIRLVARAAGVDPALVIQYFGTKDDLLAESLEMPVDLPAVLAGVEDAPDIGTEILRRALAAWDTPLVRDAVRGLLRTGLSHERAVPALRGLVTRAVLPLVQRLATDDRAELRAALVGTTIGGLAMGRLLLEVPALTQTSADELARAVGPTITRYLVGELS